MEQTITISVEEYKGLLKDSVMLQVLKNRAKQRRYFDKTEDDIRYILGIKDEEE